MPRCSDVARTSYAVLTSCYVAPMLITSCTFSRYGAAAARRPTSFTVVRAERAPVRPSAARPRRVIVAWRRLVGVVRRSRDVACLDLTRRDSAAVADEIYQQRGQWSHPCWCWDPDTPPSLAPIPEYFPGYHYLILINLLIISG